MRKLSNVLEERDRAELDDRDLRSRSDAGKERKGSEAKLTALARGLVELSDKRLLQMQLDDGVLDIVRDTRAISSAIARKRSLRRLRTALRAIDSEAVSDRLTELIEVGIPRKPKLSEELQLWCTRLMSDGDPAITEFLEAFPAADRQQLRQLVRNAGKSGTAQKRAVASLELEISRVAAALAASSETD